MTNIITKGSLIQSIPPWSVIQTDEVLVANINISMNEQCTNTHDEVQDRLYCAALTIGTKSHFWPKHKI